MVNCRGTSCEGAHWWHTSKYLALVAIQEGDQSSGMAGSAADPAALLRIYIKRGRLEDAASLALTHLHAWQTQVTLPPHKTTRPKHLICTARAGRCPEASSGLC